MNRAVTERLYEEIVAAARQPALYAAYNVPDTPLGRYEMLSLHLFLVLHRLRQEEGAAKEVAQQLTDEFFQDVDHSLRELGIGDHGIPRRVKKLGECSTDAPWPTAGRSRRATEPGWRRR